MHDDRRCSTPVGGGEEGRQTEFVSEQTPQWNISIADTKQLRMYITTINERSFLG